MEALVIAPTPSHGLPQGNSQRIAAMGAALQRLGWRITFVCYALDPVDGVALAAMRQAWERVVVVRPQPLPKLAGRAHFDLDDWCEEELLVAIADLNRLRRFDLAVVNYVWLSRAILALDPTTPTLIDTHDVFGGRADRAREAGLEPNWYWTTPEQEAEGLARADVTLSIQDEETAIFQRLIPTDRVVTVGHLAPAAFLPPRVRAGALKVGYLGSGNPWNVASLRAFATALRTAGAPRTELEVRVAGRVCDGLADCSDVFGLVGPVEDPVGFLGDVDVVANPTGIGTGLKIKTIDALRHGLPLVSAKAAMAGVATTAPEHLCADDAEVIACLRGLAANNERLRALRGASKAMFAVYAAAQMRALETAIARARRRKGA